MDRQQLEWLTNTQLIERIIELQTRLEERGRWPQTLHKPKQLLVEGPDDFAFFLALLDNMGVQDVQIQVYGGKSKLLRFLNTLTKVSGFHEIARSIAIARDADMNPQDSFYSVQNALKKVHLPIPESPQTPVDDHKRVTVLILPDTHSPGELETLLLQAVIDDPVMPCIGEYFACMQHQKIELPATMMEKARLYVFLASRKDPGLQIGTASRASYLHLESPVYDHVKEFIRLL
jgi:hypothetical protein